MPSLVVFYREPAAGVAEMWNSSAQRLGLRALRPLEPGARDWDILGHDQDRLFVELSMYPGEFTRLELYGRDIEPDWLEQILEFDLQPVGVFMTNCSSDFAEETIICEAGKCEPPAMLDAIESAWTLWGIRTRQALHNSLFSSQEEWQAAARERGFPLRAKGDYHILDMHLTDGVAWPEKVDPVTGLRADAYEDVKRCMLQPVGTRILLALTGVEPNPETEYPVWLDTLPKVAQILVEYLAEGDILARYYTPRELVILRPGLPWSEAPAELERLRTHLQKRMKPMRLRGWLSSVSWPREVADPEEMIYGLGWEKLYDREQAFRALARGLRRLSGCPLPSHGGCLSLQKATRTGHLGLRMLRKWYARLRTALQPRFTPKPNPRDDKPHFSHGPKPHSNRGLRPSLSHALRRSSSRSQATPPGTRPPSAKPPV